MIKSSVIADAIKDGSRWILEQHGDEITAFCDWLDRRPLRHVLEIGVRNGGTVAIWHAMFTGRVIGIDLPEGIDVPRGFSAIRHAELEAAYPRFKSILGDSHSESTLQRVEQLLEKERVKTVDLLFLDGDHSAAGVAADVEMYRHLVTPEFGVIAFHDIVDTELTRRVNCRVCEVWQALEGREKQEFCIGADWGGIGALVP